MNEKVLKIFLYTVFCVYFLFSNCVSYYFGYRDGQNKIDIKKEEPFVFIDSFIEEEAFPSHVVPSE